MMDSSYSNDDGDSSSSSESYMNTESSQSLTIDEEDIENVFDKIRGEGQNKSAEVAPRRKRAPRKYTAKQKQSNRLSDVDSEEPVGKMNLADRDLMLQSSKCRKQLIRSEIISDTLIKLLQETPLTNKYVTIVMPGKDPVDCSVDVGVFRKDGLRETKKLEEIENLEGKKYDDGPVFISEDLQETCLATSNHFIKHETREDRDIRPLACSSPIQEIERLVSADNCIKDLFTAEVIPKIEPDFYKTEIIYDSEGGLVVKSEKSKAARIYDDLLIVRPKAVTPNKEYNGIVPPSSGSENTKFNRKLSQQQKEEILASPKRNKQVLPSIVNRKLPLKIIDKKINNRELRSTVSTRLRTPQKMLRAKKKEDVEEPVQKISEGRAVPGVSETPDVARLRTGVGGENKDGNPASAATPQNEVVEIKTEELLNGNVTRNVESLGNISHEKAGTITRMKSTGSLRKRFEEKLAELKSARLLQKAAKEKEPPNGISAKLTIDVISSSIKTRSGRRSQPIVTPEEDGREKNKTAKALVERLSSNVTRKSRHSVKTNGENSEDVTNAASSSSVSKDRNDNIVKSQSKRNSQNTRTRHCSQENLAQTSVGPIRRNKTAKNISEDSGIHVRRSKRQHVKPQEFWLHEKRLVYKIDKDLCPVLVHRPDDESKTESLSNSSVVSSGSSDDSREWKYQRGKRPVKNNKGKGLKKKARSRSCGSRSR